MMPARSIAILTLITLRTISASPIPQHHKHAKRATRGQNVGSGLAIAFCVIFIAALFYYLGMHHERSKSWFSQRNPSTPLEHVRDDKTVTEEHTLKTRISCPLAVSSSAPIKLHDEPVEAPSPSLRYFELPIKEVYEMGLPSPKPPPRASWLSFDRKPWWLKYPENDEERRSARISNSKGMRSWFKSERSTNNVQVVITAPGRMEDVHLDTCGRKEEEEGRRSDGSTLMDWSGLDYVRRIYVGRKSRIGK